MDKSSLRTSAFVAITLSTVAVTTCLLTFPLLFHFVQRMEAEAQAEMDWCYSRSRAMWKDVSVARNLNGDPAAAAITAHRQAGHRQQRAVFFQVSTSGGSCEKLIFVFILSLLFAGCTCQRSPPGPAGKPGPDGLVTHFDFISTTENHHHTFTERTAAMAIRVTSDRPAIA